MEDYECDNGSEFLHDHLVRYFQGRKITLTRSRPYRKNDHAHVEQKNWTTARALLGYVRLEKPELVPLINDIYAHEWSSWKNFFCPSLKLKEKRRVGSRIVRKHHPPMTPYQRVLASPEISDAVKQSLKVRFDSLDPFELRAVRRPSVTLLFRMKLLGGRGVEAIIGATKRFDFILR
jgi:hypothetical protein